MLRPLYYVLRGRKDWQTIRPHYLSRRRHVSRSPTIRTVSGVLSTGTSYLRPGCVEDVTGPTIPLGVKLQEGPVRFRWSTSTVVSSHRRNFCPNVNLRTNTRQVPGNTDTGWVIPGSRFLGSVSPRFFFLVVPPLSGS